MSRGDYEPIPLDIEADIEAFQTEYQSTNQSINQSHTRFLHIITFIVSILAISWLIGIAIVVINQPINQSINHSNPSTKPSFESYSYENLSSTAANQPIDHSINQSSDSHTSQHENKAADHQSTNQLIDPSLNQPTSLSTSPSSNETLNQSFSPTSDNTLNESTNQPSISQSTGTSTSTPSTNQPMLETSQPTTQSIILTITPPIIPSINPSITPVPYPSHMLPGSLTNHTINSTRQCGVDGYRCVVSFGLYGSNDKYVKGAIANAKLMPIYYSGWLMRIYYDDSVPVNDIDMLRSLNVECLHAGDSGINGTIAGMFWRFLVASDVSVDRYIIRDTDSRLNERERAAVNEWLTSGYSMHLMRDHPSGHSLPMNGGLWGGTKGVLSSMNQYIHQWAHNTVGADQNMLNMIIYPIIKSDHLAHDAYTCLNYLNSIGFPTQRPADLSHVGQVYDGQDKIDQEAIDKYMKGVMVPKKCRRNQDWLYG